MNHNELKQFIINKQSGKFNKNQNFTHSKNPYSLNSHQQLYHYTSALINYTDIAIDIIEMISIYCISYFDFTSITTMEPLILLYEHASSITCLCLLSDNTLASGSGDSSIKIWSLIDFSCIDTLVGHNSYIYDLKLLPNSILASCSGDCSIKLWSINRGQCITSLIGHNLVISNLLSYDKYVNEEKFLYLAGGGSDGNIFIWNITKFYHFNHNKAIKYDDIVISEKLTGHSDFITCMTIYNSTHLFSGSIDNTIIIWLLSDDIKLVCTLNHSYPISCLTLLSDNILCISTKYGNLLLLQLTEIFDKLQPYQPIYLKLIHHNKNIKNISNLSYFVPSINNKDHHSRSITNISKFFDNYFVTASSIDQTCKIWKYYTTNNIIYCSISETICREDVSCLCVSNLPWLFIGDRFGGINIFGNI